MFWCDLAISTSEEFNLSPRFDFKWHFVTYLNLYLLPLPPLPTPALISVPNDDQGMNSSLKSVLLAETVAACVSSEHDEASASTLTPVTAGLHIQPAAAAAVAWQQLCISNDWKKQTNPTTWVNGDTKWNIIPRKLTCIKNRPSKCFCIATVHTSRNVYICRGKSAVATYITPITCVARYELTNAVHICISKVTGFTFFSPSILGSNSKRPTELWCLAARRVVLSRQERRRPLEGALHSWVTLCWGFCCRGHGSSEKAAPLWRFRAPFVRAAVTAARRSAVGK